MATSPETSFQFISHLIDNGLLQARPHFKTASVDSHHIPTLVYSIHAAVHDPKHCSVVFWRLWTMDSYFLL